jgi:glycosyltransferase involved in cell wall biosynthesis
MSANDSPVPDVSIVIPTFRRLEPLREALQSALSQSLVTVEAVVVDDSPEGSAEGVVAALGDARVRYLKMERPTGGKPARVRNAGWPLTRGRFVHFLDDDDRVAEGAYAAMVAALEVHPHAGVAFGGVSPFGDNPEALAHESAYFANAFKRARLASGTRSRRLIVANMLFKATVLVCSACMIRRQCLLELGGFDPEIKVVEDVEFYIRAIRRFGSTFLARPVIHYRTGTPSLMHSPLGESLVGESYDRIFKSYRGTYGSAELFALKLLARTALRWA